MRMVASTFLDHHGNATAKLLIDILNRGGNSTQQGIDAATDMQNGHIGGGKFAQFLEDVGIGTGIVGIYFTRPLVRHP